MTASVVATSRERHSHKAAKQRACEITVSNRKADSECENGAGVGSERNGRRSRIRTIAGTHFALTSSRPGHTGMPMHSTKG